MISITAIQSALSLLLGAGNVIVDKVDMAPWLVDWRGMYRGNAAAVVFPRSTEEVAKVLAFCSEHKIPVVPQGGNTGLCGGATPDARPENIIINLSRMTAIRDLNISANTITVEAGCILGDVQRLASENDRLFPLDLAAKDSCQIGGNLSTNAGGINVLRYGMARDQVLGLEVVLPSGEIWSGLRTLKKDNTGYDLKQLFIGAEGTLGIITAAALKLYAKTNVKIVALAAIQSPAAALDLLSVLREYCADRVTGFEYFTTECLALVLHHFPDYRAPFSTGYEHYILLELADVGDREALVTAAEQALGEAIENGSCHDVIMATSESQAAQLWALRENITEALSQDGVHLKHDIALPVERVHDFMALVAVRLNEKYSAIRPFVFGHYGDGNLHYNLARPVTKSPSFIDEEGKAITKIVLDTVAEFNGSFSAEHGIGQLKRDVFREKKSSVEIDLMQNLKRLLDPKGIMNPGKIW